MRFDPILDVDHATSQDNGFFFVADKPSSPTAPGNSPFCLLACPPIWKPGSLDLIRLPILTQRLSVVRVFTTEMAQLLRQRKVQRGPLIIPVLANNSCGRCRLRRHVGRQENDRVKYCLPIWISHLAPLLSPWPRMRNLTLPRREILLIYHPVQQTNLRRARIQKLGRYVRLPRGQHHHSSDCCLCSNRIRRLGTMARSHTPVRGSLPKGRRTGTALTTAASVGKAYSRYQSCNAQRAGTTIPGSLQRMHKKFERFTSPSTLASPSPFTAWLKCLSRINRWEVGNRERDVEHS
jgi:hypothetical protein